jgi:Tfp pilus assembly protein PilN
MRPVNLLPAKNRPHQPTGSRAGSSYIVLGVLALFLVGVFAYVMQTNKITAAKADIQTAQQRTAEAKARTTQLGPFGNFAQVKEQRVASVKQLADGRFDWERTVRELAHVLPSGVWLQDFDASVGAGASTASPSAAPSTGDTSTWSGPQVKLHGCAEKQPQVATALVRLRELAGVHDVVLTDSTRGDAAAGAATSDSASGASSSGCGAHGKQGNYDFNATVQFDAPSAANSTPTAPRRLGGGS